METGDSGVADCDAIWREQTEKKHNLYMHESRHDSEAEPCAGERRG